MTRTLGLDLGASKLQACLLDLDGRVLLESRAAGRRDLDPAAFLELAADVAGEVRRRAGDFAGVGLGFPGLVDSATGLAHSSVMIAGWKEVPIACRLRELLGVPAFVDNDVNNFARAELALRPEEPSGSFLFVAVGTGIGGALCLRGEVWNGASGLAGEIGHLCIDHRGPPCGCGGRGCVNLYASGSAIEARLGLTAGALARGEHRGRAAAEEVLAEAAEALGQALASALNLLNLPLVVLGGGVPELGESYRRQVETSFRRLAFREVAAATRIELARAGYRGGAVGAALLARAALA